MDELPIFQSYLGQAKVGTKISLQHWKKTLKFFWPKEPENRFAGNHNYEKVKGNPSDWKEELQLLL